MRILIGAFFTHEDSPNGGENRNGVYLNGDRDSEVSEEEIISDYTGTPPAEPEELLSSPPSVDEIAEQPTSTKNVMIAAIVPRGEFDLLLRGGVNSGFALQDRVQILVDGEVLTPKVERLGEVVHLTTGAPDGGKVVVRLIDGGFEGKL